MRLGYVAGPYRGPTESDVDRNIQSAKRVAQEVWQLGVPVVCPHLNTQFFGGLAPDDLWLTGDLEILRRCDFVVLCPGWENSQGTQEEVKLADELGLDMFEWPRDREALVAWLEREG